MTLGELKQKTTKILEEYSSGNNNFSDDEDIKNKITIAINAVVDEVSRFRAVKKSVSILVSELKPIELPKEVYKVTEAKMDGKSVFYHIYGKDITFSNTGEAVIYYDAVPSRITDDTSNEDVLPFEENVSSILPYGVAKMLLIGTGEYNAASEFEEKYYSYLRELEITGNSAKVKVFNMFNGSI